MTEEEQVETQARRLFPHLRELLHHPDELGVHAKKLYPHIQDEFHKDVGKGVVTEATGMFRKALWWVGGGLLALSQSDSIIDGLKRFFK